jgi:hypothetical protein
LTTSGISSAALQRDTVSDSSLSSTIIRRQQVNEHH